MTQESDRQPRTGRVVETVGRRVRVADDEGDRVCFLQGQRAVIGDRVRWRPAAGGGGVIQGVAPRTTVLSRVDHRGKPRIVAANLTGIVVVCSAIEPPFHAPLLDRYIVAARTHGLDVTLCLNKTDLGVPAEVRQALEIRREAGVPYVETSAVTSTGLDALRGHIERMSPSALVGPSGVGKTSLLAALLPDQDVGPTGPVSSRDGMGRHTTTRSILLEVGNGAEVADSPGIRTFTPDVLDLAVLRNHFPGLDDLQCRYRDCQHREDEDGCAAPQQAPPQMLASYRALLRDVDGITKRLHPRNRARRLR